MDHTASAPGAGLVRGGAVNGSLAREDLRGRSDAEGVTMRIEFSGPIWYWRGPAPFYFGTVPEADSRELKSVSSAVTYGWGMIPVTARVGDTEWRTSLFPKDGRYVLPLKVAVRKAEALNEGGEVAVRLELW